MSRRVLTHDKAILEMYDEDGMSIRAIGKKLGISHQTVKRRIEKYHPLRDRSAAQKNALDTGTSKHPTEGRERTEAEKAKISDGIAAAWENASEEELQKRSDDARARWDAMSQVEKDNLLRLAHEAIRQAADEGSQLEKFVQEGLTKRKFVVEYHKDDLIPNPTLEVDLFLPQYGIAIEIDGPSHFLPIWGHEKLQKAIRADMEKMGLLFHAGIRVIRIKQMTKKVSQKVKRDCLNAVLEAINEIENDRTKMVIEREV